MRTVTTGSIRSVSPKPRFRISGGAILLLALSWASTARAQDPQDSVPSTPPVISQEESVKNASAPCLQPPPMVTLKDYDGPFAKTIGLFTQQVERKTVHPPHFKPGAVLCSIELRDKFVLFVRESYDPIIFLTSAFSAGISQAENGDSAFRQGFAGYAKRFGASYADQADFRFFKDFVYPSIFSEDPRYYRLAHGSGRKRLIHAMEHVVVAHSDNGNRMFNFSEWLGTVSAISLSNVYHPGNKRGFTPTAEGLGFTLVNDMGFDVLREFWPEISRKFKLPFRAEVSEDNTMNASPPGK